MGSSSVRFITGKAEYLEDLRETDLFHMSILRSPYAHAKIGRIDVSKVPKHGVTIFTPEIVNQECKKIPVIWTAEGMRMVTQPVLAKSKVRYVGEPIVCAVSRDRHQTKDAVELIDVDFEPLEAVTDVEAAMKKGSSILHEEFSDNLGLHVHRKKGDVEGAFQTASVLLKEKLRPSRVAPVAMEPRGVLSRYDVDSGTLTVWSSTQIPYMLRHVLSQVLGLQENRIRVITPDLGGGFGSKDSVYPEEILTSFASMKLLKPVRWVEERRENMMATNHDRDQVQHVEVASTRTGQILGLRAKVLINAGAYYRFHGAREVFLFFHMLSGQYRIPCVEADVYSVFTNTASTFPYRGPGSTEANFLMERIMDILSRETGVDPIEVRLKNMISPDQFPYTTVVGATYDAGNYPACLRRALQVSGYEEFRKEQEKARIEGRYLGIGIGCYVDLTGLGPSKLMSSLGVRQGGWEKATVVIDQSGRVTVLSGIQPMGQGTEFGIAQLVGTELGVPAHEVTVLCGDTSHLSFGGGAFASRGIAVGGTAAALAARKVKDKILRIAAHMLEAKLDDLVYENARVYVRDSPSTALTLGEIADNAYVMTNMPPGLEPGLEAFAAFDPPNFAYSYGAIIAKVEVDPDTGVVKLVSMYAVHDCGKEVNPPSVEGQIQGGMVQGLGEAMLEGVTYDENGQLLSGTLADYLIPSATDVPWLTIESMETLSPINPLGVRGVGESGMVGVPGALANAVEDALSPLKCKITQIPLKSDYLWELMKSSIQIREKPKLLQVLSTE
jgi:carbon-monoxide dehydrogenase large subunit